MNADNKTLVILTPGFPANEEDSACLPFPQLFVKNLRRTNPSLQIIVLTFQYPFHASTYTWQGVSVIAFDGANKGGLRRLLIWKAVWEKIKAISKTNHIAGILNFWMGECGLLGKWAAKKYAVSSYTWLLGQDARKGNRYFVLIRPRAQNLVALSDFIADEFYRNYGMRPATVIPPGIDASVFGVPPGYRDIDILGAGSLIPLKCYDIFIRVVARLAKTHPNIKTMICGQGPDRKSLQTLIDAAGLERHIQLCGELPHAEVLALMQRARVFMHPSSYEGFGFVLLEALYAGASTVSFCRPMHQLFKNQWVVQTEDQMTDKINNLLADNNCGPGNIMTWPIEQTCRQILALYGL